ncbi:MAG: HIT family protein [Spongiibacter sp.]|uniref:HIT family protein n=1 Tax=Spongiibacter thalassae TaxID=2721624 RepID=A0ABX1GFH2_9GAMM|nr:HIT family protein [Spongiibacter thalassae]NKI17954.1 HIT family protein [Spongiibacter thalassae]
MASIFSRIIAKELPGHFVWEDEQAVAIMTIQPVRPGHLLVIPKQEVDHWDDLPEALSAHLMTVSQKLAKALKTVYQCQRVSLQVVGLEVPHVHFHLVPLDSMSDADFSRASNADGDALATEAEKIRQALTR